MQRSDDALERLVDWMRGRGFQPGSKLRVAYYGPDKGYGMLAAADIAEGEELFALPEWFTQLRSRNPTGAAAGVDALLADPELDKHNSLVIRLMHEHLLGAASEWAPYLDLLRGVTFTTPYSWPQKELAHLEGTAVTQRMEEDIDVREFFEKAIAPLLQRHLPPAEAARYGLELFRRMTHVVMSRAFSLNDGDQAFILPYADFFNARTRDFDARLGEQAGRIFMYAVRPIKADAEVFITYGELPNTRLLLRYGFVEEDNPFDYVQIDPDMVLEVLSGAGEEEAGAEYVEQLAAYLEEYGPESVILTKGGELPAELVTLLKLMLLPPEDLPSFLTRAPFLTIGTSFANADAGLSALMEDFPADLLAKELDKLALLVLAARSSGYPSTLDEDRAALAKTRDFYERCGLVVRIGERQVLADAMGRITAKYQRNKHAAPAPAAVEQQQEGKEADVKAGHAAKKARKGSKPAAATNRPKLIE